MAEYEMEPEMRKIDRWRNLTLVAGFWIWQVKSLEEAVEWAKRCPGPMPGEEGELEIRPVFEADDFGKEFTTELRAQEERLRAEIGRQQKS